VTKSQQNNRRAVYLVLDVGYLDPVKMGKQNIVKNKGKIERDVKIKCPIDFIHSEWSNTR
jgi:hypothetical protein